MNYSKISTGIKGLDEILDGGVLQASSYLIVGSAGTGKTLLSLQFLSECAKRKMKCLYITFAEPEEIIRRNVASFGWNLSDIHFVDFTKWIANSAIEGEYSVFHPSEVEEESIWKQIYKALEKTKPNYLVLDSVTFLRYLSIDEYQFRKQIQWLINYLGKLNCISFLLFEPSELEKENSLALAVDGVIFLRNTISPSRVVEHRTVEVQKHRGSPFLSG